MTRKTQSRRKELPQRGFSLMEMMVVLTIIGILLAFALPRMEPTPGLRLNAAFQQIDALAQISRNGAVASGETRRIAFVTSSADPDLDRSAIFALQPVEVAGEEETRWRVAAAPQFLDDGLFFDPASCAGLPETTITWNEKEMGALFVEFLPSGLCPQENGRILVAIGLRNEDRIEFDLNAGRSTELLFTRLGGVVPAIPNVQP